MELAQKHGIKEGEKIYNEVLDAVSQWHDIAKKVGISSNTIGSIEKILKECCL
jgi:hypothetical protein